MQLTEIYKKKLNYCLETKSKDLTSTRAKTNPANLIISVFFSQNKFIAFEHPGFVNAVTREQDFVKSPQHEFGTDSISRV